MLDQFMHFKKKHEDAVLFYRMGDFYEMFFEDAKIASEALGLRLTQRAHGKASSVPLAGFPYHQLDSYLTRMVNAGHKVVIVEQVEDPKKAKGLVKRDVVRIVTAGTNPAIIDGDRPTASRIAAVIEHKDLYGYAWADVGSGEFKAGQFSKTDLKLIFSQTEPVELLVPDNRRDIVTDLVDSNNNITISKLENWVWEETFAKQTLTDHFGTVGLKGFGMDQLDLAVSAAGALLHYLKDNLRTDPNHLTSLSRGDTTGRLWMEATTRRNLELVNSLSGNQHATLFAVIDRTLTSPGRKLLYMRLMEPLADKALIEERLDAVAELVHKKSLRTSIRDLLKQSGDLQRALARLATGRGSGRDLSAIRDTLELLPEYSRQLENVYSDLLNKLSGQIESLPTLWDRLSKAIADTPPLSITGGGLIRDGYDPKIDELREIRYNGKNWLKNFEAAERSRTGIPKLNIKFNKVFGYFIEITNSQLNRVPEDYIRRQTLVNAERFITPALQEYAEKLINAEDIIAQRENKLYLELEAETLTYSREIQKNANLLADLDFLTSLATLAEDDNYCRPTLTDDDTIVLTDSRHPVVEKLMPPGQQFVSNDLTIGGDDPHIYIVTGPNMAGKSTYLRQIGLITVLAQIGSFVPAKEATIGVVDRLFTRIGALDNLAGGESTFLVEMMETASILHNATSKSLVLFDEVGRGTSTFDGLSLAWAIVEYLHEIDNLCPRTLFATHYHEMVDLENHLDKVANRNVAVREIEDNIVFLRKIIPGGCDRSFGIHVAQMAGLPMEVIDRAKEVLRNLEANNLNPVEQNGEIKPASQPKKPLPKAHQAQLSFFDPVDTKLRQHLEKIDVNNLTPLEALNLINELKQIMK